MNTKDSPSFTFHFFDPETTRKSATWDRPMVLIKWNDVGFPRWQFPDYFDKYRFLAIDWFLDTTELVGSIEHDWNRCKNDTKPASNEEIYEYFYNSQEGLSFFGHVNRCQFFEYVLEHRPDVKQYIEQRKSPLLVRIKKELDF